MHVEPRGIEVVRELDHLALRAAELQVADQEHDAPGVPTAIGLAGASSRPGDDCRNGGRRHPRARMRSVRPQLLDSFEAYRSGRTDFPPGLVIPPERLAWAMKWAWDRCWRAPAATTRRRFLFAGMGRDPRRRSGRARRHGGAGRCHRRADRRLRGARRGADPAEGHLAQPRALPRAAPAADARRGRDGRAGAGAGRRGRSWSTWDTSRGRATSDQYRASSPRRPVLPPRHRRVGRGTPPRCCRRAASIGMDAVFEPDYVRAPPRSGRHVPWASRAPAVERAPDRSTWPRTGRAASRPSAARAGCWCCSTCWRWLRTRRLGRGRALPAWHRRGRRGRSS